MQVVARTDVGKIRDINEDYIFHKVYANGLIIAVVADGMGGHQAGEIASKTAVNKVLEIIEANMCNSLSTEEYKNFLIKAIDEANKCVFMLSSSNKEYNGMGTTIVAAVISDDWLILAHIGDSRAYLIKENDYVQLTKDHSLVNELLLNGQISEDEALIHPQRNVLTRALGTDQKVKIDSSEIKWGKNQTLVLCSDGLTNYVSDSTIIKIINNQSFAIEKKADILLTEAIKAGGEDNISLIIVENN